MGAYQFSVNGVPVYLPAASSEAVFSAVEEALPGTLTIYRQYRIPYNTEDAARTALNTNYIPSMRNALTLYGLPESVPLPCFFTGTSLQPGSPFGLTSPYQVDMASGTYYTLSNPSTGEAFSSNQIRTDINNQFSASTYVYSRYSFPYLSGSFSGINTETIMYFVTSPERPGKAVPITVTAGLSQSGNVWYVTAFAECAYGIVTMPDGCLDGIEYTSMDDPLDQGGDSSVKPPDTHPFTGIGGGGTFNRKSDSIGWAVTPSISPADTGLVTLYVGTASDMHNLANFLWSGLFDVDTFKKLFTSPMDCIIGASMLPVTPPNNAASTIIFGNVDTEVPMASATTTYVRVDCGSIALTEYWQAYLDYAPYTKVHIYLPFIGFKELNTDEVMGKNVAVKYLIECLSGTFTVQVGVEGGAKILAQYAGSCAIQVPMTANNWGQAIGSVIQVAGQAIGGFASGGAAGALMAGGLGAASSAISGGFKPEIQRNGSVTGAGGWMASMTPYIIIEWPRQSKPANLNKFEGYPSNDTMILGTCVGYTKVEEINLDGVPATSPELEEIESLLKGGVLI